MKLAFCGNAVGLPQRIMADGRGFFRVGFGMPQGTVQDCADIRELFTQHGLRCTRQRLALYEALRHNKTHPTAEELYRQVHTGSDRMSRATVYNTLEMLCRAGLARQMPTASGTNRFDADTAGHVHVQLIETSEITDVPVHLAERLVHSLPKPVIAEIEQQLGVRIDGACIQLIAHAMGAGGQTQRRRVNQGN